MQHHVTNGLKFTRVKNAVAAGTSNQTTSSVDMLGWDGVFFIFLFGTLSANAVTTPSVQQSSDDGVLDTYDDLAGTGQLPQPTTDNNKIVLSDIFRPSKRYVRAAIGRSTGNAVIDGVIAVQYRGSFEAVTQDATTVFGWEKFISPAEGTA